MRVRLSDDQIQKIAATLKHTNWGLAVIVGRVTGLYFADVDDTSWQTLETLIFWCGGCEQWQAIEDAGASGDFCAACDASDRGDSLQPTREEVYGLQELL
jgi:hypothetical protein